MQHVRAIGIQIQAKVLETGYQVDMNGSCWASRPEVGRPTAGEHGFCEKTQEIFGQEKLPQEKGHYTERWGEGLRGDDAPSGPAGPNGDGIRGNNDGSSIRSKNNGPRENPTSPGTRPMRYEEWEGENRPPS